MTMPRLNFRLPPELLKAAEQMAEKEGMNVGAWVRKLMEEVTGVSIEVKKGLAGADEKTRKRIQRLGVKAAKKAKTA